MTWEVSGGRMPYQIALERDDAGSLRIHCTCADAVFRAEDEGRNTDEQVLAHVAEMAP